VGIVVLALNLRPVAVSIGPVLDEITDELGMSATAAGVLTTLPVLAYAIFGALAPRLGHRIGVHRLTLASLLVLVAGLAVRAGVDSAAPFLALSFLALAATAIVNVYLPSLVKLHFPNRVGLLTSVYATALAIGIASGSAVTAPVAEQFGSWRWGLLGWAFTAAIATLPWFALVRHDRTSESAGPGIRLGQVARTRLGWTMAVFFACQAIQAFAVFGWFAQIYRDAGFSATTAGLLLGVITAIGIPISFWIPGFASRLTNQSWLMVGLAACYPIGYLGLLIAPVEGAWVWAVVIGASTGVFPLAMTLIGLRSRTDVGTAALSGFTQSVGYLIAGIGPFGMGFLYDLTGGWTVPLITLTVLAVPQLIAGLMLSRPAYIEDALPGSVRPSAPVKAEAREGLGA